MLTKNDYKIMMKLYNENGDTEFRSFTIAHMSEMTGLSVSKIRVSMRNFKELGYVKEGARQHLAKTYYLTDGGKRKLEEII